MRTPHPIALLAVLASALVGCGPEPTEKPDDTKAPPPAGELSGRVIVLDAAGKKVPLPGAVVVLVATAERSVADAEGTFAFTGLAAGPHALRCEADLDKDGRTDVGFYFPAVVLGATEGKELGDTLAARPGTVRGLVKDAGGPVAGALVVLRAREPGSAGERVAASDAGGRFVLDRVLTGGWTIAALRAGSPGVAGETELEVGPAALVDVTVELSRSAAPGATLYGRVRTPATAPEPVTIEAFGSEGAAKVEVNPDTPFELALPAGLYTVTVRSANRAVRALVVPDLLVEGRTELHTARPLEPLADDAARDLDGDGTPAATDPDDDGDGCADASEPAATRLDPLSCLDSDADGLGDGLDPDRDGDHVLDVLDACPDRNDPPDLPARPSGCDPYPQLAILAASTPAGIVDEPSDVTAFVTGALGEAKVEASVTTKPEGAITTLTPGGEGRWTLLANLPGSYTVHLTASDALGDAFTDLVVLLEAPPIVVAAPEHLDLDVEELREVSARLPFALDGVAWHWTDATGNAAATLSIDPADARVTSISAISPGEFVLRAEATRGARSGHCDVAVTVRAPPIAIDVPATLEFTTGEPRPITARTLEPLDALVWKWKADPALIVATPDAATTTIDGTIAGEYPLDVEVVRGARIGSRRVTVRAFAPGAVTVAAGDGGPLTATAGSQATFRVALDPPLEGATTTYIPRATNPAGATFSGSATSFAFLAPAPASFTFDVLARAGARLARGSFTVVVGAAALNLGIVQVPRPYVRPASPVVLTASTPDLPADAAITWSWVPAATNPESVAAPSPASKELRFTPTTAGRYAFEVTAVAGNRRGTTTYAFDVSPPRDITVGAFWYGNYVGGTLYIGATVAETLSGAVWSWSESSSNPAVLGVAGVTRSSVNVPVTTEGVYQVTAQVAAGGRVGRKTVTIRVQPNDPEKLVFSLAPSPAEGTRGFPQAIYPYSDKSLSLMSTTWVEDPGNPAPVTVTRRENTTFLFVAPKPGLYRFSATGVQGTATGSAETAVEILPEVPVDARPVGRLSTGTAVYLTATTPDTSGTPTWLWQLTSGPTGAANVLSSQRALPTAFYSLNFPGRYVFTVTATIGSRRGSAVVEFTTGESLPRFTVQAAGSSDDYYHSKSIIGAAVGERVPLYVSCNGCTSPTYDWHPYGGTTVTPTNAQSALATFVPTAPGDYLFEVYVWGYGDQSDRASANVRVRVTATKPDAYIDGPPGFLPWYDPGESNYWRCASGRPDAVSYRWEKVSGDVDGTATISGQFLNLSPRSMKFPISAWKCTVTMADGQTATKTRIAVVTPVTTQNVVFVKPVADTPGATGTEDDPVGFITGWTPFYGCWMGMMCTNSTQQTAVLFEGTYTYDDFRWNAELPGTVGHVIGGVSRTTFEYDPVRFRTLVDWSNAEFGYGVIGPAGNFMAIRNSIIDSVDIRLTAKAGKTNLLTPIVLEGNSVITRSNIELNLNAGQAVQPFAIGPGNGAQRVSLVGNRIRITGGVAAAAVTENCRGLRLAHNLVVLDAASAIPKFLKTDCSANEVQAQLQVTDNVFYLRNNATVFDAWGSPATDSGGRFGGNWFQTTGKYAVAANQVPALDTRDLTVLNAGRVNGGLDGGNNSDDPACFPVDPPADLRSFRIASSSPCAKKAVGPNLAYVPLDHYARDWDGTFRDPAGYAAPGGVGTIAIGPDQPAP